jgi:hypothetical protein
MASNDSTTTKSASEEQEEQNKDMGAPIDELEAQENHHESDGSDEGATSEQPRKRAAIGEGISAGPAFPLPFCDAESTPPQGSKTRPASAHYGSASDTELRKTFAFKDIQRPHVENMQLFTADKDLPPTPASFDPANIASIQIQNTRNQAPQPKPQNLYKSLLTDTSYNLKVLKTHLYLPLSVERRRHRSRPNPRMNHLILCFNLRQDQYHKSNW